IAGRQGYSDDKGATWTSVSGYAMDTTYDIAVSPGGVWVAVGNESTGPTDRVLRSTDGITWATVTYPAGAETLLSVCWHVDKFVAVGTTGTVYTSPTGATGDWTSRTSGETEEFQQVRSDGSLVRAVAGALMIQSADGITWATDSSANGGNCITRTANGWLVGSAGGFTYRTTADGDTWTQ